MEKMKMHTPDVTDENIARIAEIFPNCVTEAEDENGNLKRSIDFDQLRQELSGSIVEGPQERYQLNWPGKREALLTANAPIAKTLRPCREESVDFDTTKNLFIEGDNLDALKLLQETYLGKVKLIYIDPPYNTGNDFIYEDNFAEDKDAYFERSLQKDDEGNRLVVNSESNGRFHSDWLSMLYPRLKLARTLLRDDGAIFVSIGVEELATLRLLLAEIFGERNFVETFSWVKTSTPPALSTKSRKTVEYVVCFEKNRNDFQYIGDLLDGGDQPLLNTGNTRAELLFPNDRVLFKTDVFPDGPLKAHSSERVDLLDDLVLSNGYADKPFRMRGEFKWTQGFFDEEIKKGTTFIIKSDKLSIRFIRSEEGYKRPTNLIKDESLRKIIDKPNAGVDTNENASSELVELMGANVFDHPKPVSLIAYLSRFLTREDDIILDFFAGSGTTAHATFLLNAKDNQNRRFILVQLPESLDLASAVDANAKKIIENATNFLEGLGRPLNISEITKERVRRAAKKIHDHANLRSANLDIGFRVLKIDSSNMKDVYYSPDEQAQANLLDQVTNIKEDRTAEDLLFQVLLDWGVDLSLPIAKETIHGKDVFFVDQNALAACFDDGVSEDLVKELAKRQPLRVVFRDSAFVSDDVKINTEQIFKQISPGTEVKTI